MHHETIRNEADVKPEIMSLPCMLSHECSTKRNVLFDKYPKREILVERGEKIICGIEATFLKTLRHTSQIRVRIR